MGSCCCFRVLGDFERAGGRDAGGLEVGDELLDFGGKGGGGGHRGWTVESHEEAVDEKGGKKERGKFWWQDKRA